MMDMSYVSVFFASLSFSSVHDVGVAAAVYLVNLALRLSNFALFLFAVTCLFMQRTQISDHHTYNSTDLIYLLDGFHP